MAAMSATLIEAGENQGKAGRALRIIYARLGANTSGAADALEGYGVAVKDAQGNMRPLSEVLHDLDAIWPSLTKGERQALAQSVAGKNHYVRFLKVAENYNRMQELAVDALHDQDAAQDEVNKRLEENITKLREAEANLANYKAELGEAFLPAIAAATQKQADFTEALADMANMDFIGMDKALQFMVTAQQYMQMFGPALDLFINLKQMTVAIQTQHAITKSMMGVDLVRANAYGGMQNMSRAMTGNLTQQQFLENAIAVTGAVREARYKNMQVATGARVIELKKVIEAQHQIATSLEAQLIFSDLLVIGARNAQINAKKVADTLKAQHQTMVALGARTRLSLEEEMGLRIKSQAGIHTEIRLLNEKYALLTLEGQQAYQTELALEGTSHATKMANIREEIMAEETRYRRTQVDKAQQLLYITNERNHENTLIGLKAEGMAQEQAHAEARAAISETHKISGYHEMAMLEQKLNAELEWMNTSGMLLFNEQERLIAVIKHTEGEQAHTQALKAKGEATKELSMIMSGNLTEEQMMIQLDATLITLKTKLNDLISKEGWAAIEAAGGLHNMALGEDRLAVTSEKLTPRLAMGSRAMNTFSMRAGVASMALGMFSHNSKAAKASMALMMLSMAPMIYQAGKATTELAGTTAALSGKAAAEAQATASTVAHAGAMVAEGEAAKVATFWTSSFGIALKSVGIGIAIAAVAYLAVTVAEMAGWFESATDAANDFDASIRQTTVTAESYASYTTTSYKDLTENIDDLTHQIDLMTSAQESATDSAKALYQSQINDLTTIRDLEQDILNIRNASAMEALAQKDPAALRTLLELGSAMREVENPEEWADPIGFGKGHDEGLDRIAARSAAFIAENEGLLEELDRAYAPHLRGLLVTPYDEGTIHLGSVKVKEEYADLYQFIMDMGISTEEEFTQAIIAMLKQTEENADDTAGAIDTGVINPIDDATNALYEFNNAREEMFYGMSSSNLTGDLVRQVVREGVENLINTTEVIMTNQFMGMTTEEAADAIIQQIEEKSGLSGINLSMQ